MRLTLDAEVLDGGEQVTSVTLDTSRLGPIDPASVTAGTFTVHAKAQRPFALPPGEVIFNEYDGPRAVTAARLNRRGDIVLELSHGEGRPGGGTLGYILGKGRNVRLDLDYTITQTSPITLRNRRSITIERFRQGRLDNPEVDAFDYEVSRSGMNYRLFSPDRARGERPLVVWLHGGGEGGLLTDDYYDNETPLRANRGALGFATDEAQRIFRGAHVVAPQSPSYWMEDGDRFAPLIREVINEVARRQDVDRDRIYVAGCSNGGYMTMKMTTVYRNLFAASVPICGVVQPFGSSSSPLIPDAQLRRITTPTWLVTSRNDPTVPAEPNTVHAHDLVPGSLMTLYDRVVWNGYEFNGHWSWIYVARNHPSIRGTRIWQWMADQRS